MSDSDSDELYTLDPFEDFCSISGQSTVIIGTKLYITTGFAYVKAENNTKRIASSPWIREVDLSTSFPLSQMHTRSRVLPPSIAPVDIPNVQGAAFFFDPQTQSIIYSQGSSTPGGQVIADEENDQSFGRNGKSWIGRWNAANESFAPWEEIDTPFDRQSGRVSTQRKFYDPVSRRGYMYGGGVDSEIEANRGEKNQFVTYDFAEELWTNTTTPFGVFDGVGAAVPYYKADGGVLGIVFGGNLNGTPLRMNNIFVHDIATDEWYRQRTNGPEPLARGHFCATAVRAADNSSTQIIMLGGFGESHPRDVFSLSLPSFTWTKLDDPTADFLPGPGSRLQPSCDLINGHLFSVYGGRNLVDGDSGHCDENGNALFLYNLNTREWMEEFDAEDKDEYMVPADVYNVIGGDSSGGATLTAPPDGFTDPKLSALFTISTPTGSNPSPTGPNPTPTSAPTKSVPIGPLVGGLVGGLVLIAALLFGLWLIRRQKKQQLNLAPLPPPGYSSGFPTPQPGAPMEYYPPKSPREADSVPVSELPLGTEREAKYGGRGAAVNEEPVELPVPVPPGAPMAGAGNVMRYSDGYGGYPAAQVQEVPERR